MASSEVESVAAGAAAPLVTTEAELEFASVDAESAVGLGAAD